MLPGKYSFGFYVSTNNSTFQKLSFCGLKKCFTLVLTISSKFLFMKGDKTLDFVPTSSQKI